MPPRSQLANDDLVYEVSSYPRLLWEEWKEQSPKAVDVADQGVSRQDQYPDLMREMFARLMRPNINKLDTPNADWAVPYHEQADQLTDFAKLSRLIGGDEVQAGIGANAIGEQLLTAMKPTKSNLDTDRIRQTLETLKSMKRVTGGDRFDERIEEQEALLQQAEEEAANLEAGVDPTAIREALRAGCEQASQEILEHNALMSAFSFGDQPGVPVQRTTEEKRELADKFKANDKLKRIGLRLGRARNIALEKQRHKVRHAPDEISDVVTGNDINRLLTPELMGLCSDDDDIAAAYFARWASRSMLQYELKGTDRTGRGPIIVCCDESGSMDGEPEIFSKAVALAMLDIAIRQKRNWACIHFDSEVQCMDVYEDGRCYRTFKPVPAFGGITTGTQPDHQWKDTTELAIGVAEHFSDGGTSFVEPLGWAVDLIDRLGGFRNADVLFVTDGHSSMTDEAKGEFRRNKQRLEFALFSVMLDCKSGADLAELSDRVWEWDSVLADDADFNEVAYAV